MNDIFTVIIITLQGTLMLAAIFIMMYDEFTKAMRKVIAVWLIIIAATMFLLGAISEKSELCLLLRYVSILECVVYWFLISFGSGLFSSERNKRN